MNPVALLLLIRALAATADAPKITVAPARPHQGDTIIVTALLPEANSATLHFRGREFIMHRTDGGWRALLGTSPDTPPGRHELLMRSDLGELRRTLAVAKRPFPVQRLNIPPSRNRLRKDPRIADDHAAIGAALARQTADQLWRGKFQWPVRDVLRTQYGMRRIVNGDANYGWHKGYDIRGKTGTPVRAAADGVVALARKCVLEGNLVLLDHGHGVISAHFHLSSSTVAEGQRVKGGEVIGRVGHTGISSGPHLHWGVYVNGVAVDPKWWLTHRW